MGALALLALATGRRRRSLAALAATVVVLLLVDPWLSRSYGFVLSALATGALVTLATAWTGRWSGAGCPAAAGRGVRRPAGGPAGLRAGGRAAQRPGQPGRGAGEPPRRAGRRPGHRAGGAGDGGLGGAPRDGRRRWPGWPAASCGGSSTSPGGRPACPRPPIGWPGSLAGAVLLAAVTLVAVTAVRSAGRRPVPAGACAVVLVVALVVPARAPGWPPRDWVMAACDVGQGDALVLAAGPGAAVVVDAGPDPAAVDRCLRRLGVRSVAVLLLTHLHADHVEGVPGRAARPAGRRAAGRPARRAAGRAGPGPPLGGGRRGAGDPGPPR